MFAQHKERRLPLSNNEVIQLLDNCEAKMKKFFEFKYTSQCCVVYESNVHLYVSMKLRCIIKRTPKYKMNNSCKNCK